VKDGRPLLEYGRVHVLASPLPARRRLRRERCPLLMRRYSRQVLAGQRWSARHAKFDATSMGPLCQDLQMGRRPSWGRYANPSLERVPQIANGSPWEKIRPNQILRDVGDDRNGRPHARFTEQGWMVPSLSRLFTTQDQRFLRACPSVSRDSPPPSTGDHRFRVHRTDSSSRQATVRGRLISWLAGRDCVTHS
jgi:hypothetical protein